MHTPKYGLAISDDIDKIYPRGKDYTVNGICSHCGNCCTHHLHILPSEIARIKQYIQTHDIKPCHHTKATNGEAGGFVIDFVCPFFDDSKHICRIYEVRPAICQVYQCNHSQEEISDHYDALFAKGLASLPEFLNHPAECNVGQTFFPEYIPNAQDLVVINQLHMLEHYAHENDIYICTDNKRKRHGKTERLLLNARKQGDVLWFDEQGLTRIDILK